MKRIGLLLTIVFLAVSLNFAQKPYKIKLNKEAFQMNATATEDTVNLAWKKLLRAHRLFKQDLIGSYKLAIEDLLFAYNVAQTYAPIAYELGVSYLKIGDEVNGKKFIEEAFDLDPNVAPDIHLWLGRAYHLNSEFEEAIDEYQLYLESLDSVKQKKLYAQTKRFIEQANNGIYLRDNREIHIIIDNLGEGVNTEYPEYAPVFAPFDSIVYFTSKRPSKFNQNRNKFVDNDYYEDIYFTSYKVGRWHKADLFPKPVNSRGNDASIAVNPYGTEFIIRRGFGKGTFYLVKRKTEEKWSRPKRVIRKINNPRYNETTLTFSRDSSVVYFVSDRPGGYGGKDIWYSKRDPVRGWTKPKNLGPVINTPYDEEAVFIAENDSVLYFASKGHNSMGGYDIFRSYKLPDGRWSEPENLGYGLNSPEDDLFIFVSQDGRTGYFTTKGHGGYGDFDIFEFLIYTPKPIYTEDAPDLLIAYLAEPVKEVTLEGPVPIKTLRLTVVKGTVTEYGTGKPLNATIEIVDNETGKVVQVVKTNATTGEYMVMLPSGKNYGMSVNARGYMFHSENFQIPPTTGYQEIRLDVQLMPMDPGSKVVLRNVFFDFNSANLKPESYPELDRLAEILKRYPGIVVEISGHTDNVGSFQYNMKLSQKRAEAVVQYLISKGVPPSSLVAKGYGPTKPIAPNDTEEGRALNRRVEAKVLVNPYSVRAQQEQPTDTNAE